ncbi:MAG: phosphoribosyltransferase [Rhizobiaceae bacterium]|nr:phosphoribosyltransferase [Rhizobiaceae bacterium]
MTAALFESSPHAFWQEIVAAGTYEETPAGGHHTFFPAKLADGRQFALPIRERDGGREALASLILNQASLEVLDTLARELADMARALAPDIIVGLPTLGLPLAQEAARMLGHKRYVALSTSRKFWYDEDLSVPLRSITSPGQEKRLYMDPRMLPLLQDRSVFLIDDVLSTGTSILAACQLLEKCGIEPALIGCAMLQTQRWRAAISSHDPNLVDRVLGVFSTPRLTRGDDGGWRPHDRSGMTGPA